jgi:hypothetical protein
VTFRIAVAAKEWNFREPSVMYHDGAPEAATNTKNRLVTVITTILIFVRVWSSVNWKLKPII